MVQREEAFGVKMIGRKIRPTKKKIKPTGKKIMSNKRKKSILGGR